MRDNLIKSAYEFYGMMIKEGKIIAKGFYKIKF